MHRCATGEHRGSGLGEGLAELTAIVAAIISDKEPGWEKIQAIVWSARDVWPHMCVHHPWRADGVAHGELGCWQP